MTIQVYTDKNTGQVRVRVDSPGERAVSDGVHDVEEFIQQVADAAGVSVQFNQPSE